jgi:hypothetical protein
LQTSNPASSRASWMFFSDNLESCLTVTQDETKEGEIDTGFGWRADSIS